MDYNVVKMFLIFLFLNLFIWLIGVYLMFGMIKLGSF